MDGLGPNADLIAALYDAASGDAPFSTLATRIAAEFDSFSCILHVRNGFAGPIEQLSVTPNYTPEILADYNAYYYQHDVWANLGLRQPPGFIRASDDLPMSQAEFRESLIYRDQGRFTQCFYLLGAIIPVGGPDDAFAVFGIHRGESDPIFGPAEKQKGALLLPHLKRALQLRERLARLEIGQSVSLLAMETLSLGMLLVADGGRVLFANNAAIAILRDGASLTEQSGRLRAGTSAIDQQLQRLIREAIRAAEGKIAVPGGLLRLPRADAAPLTLSIYPFQSPQPAKHSRIQAALIFLTDPGTQRAPRPEILAQIYNLTRAEAKLYGALLSGARLQDYADQFSLSLQTVKTHLARLFAKTGHSRQSELIRDALGNPIFWLNRS